MGRVGGFGSKRTGLGRNVGSGVGLFKNREEGFLQFKTLLAGSGITINAAGTEVAITSSGGGAGNPGGSDTQVQYNDDDAFNGNSAFIFNKNDTTLTTPQTHVSGNLFLGGSLVPIGDTQYDLGSTTKRWSNLYTGDLHLKNERGDWTLFEEANELVVKNNLTGEFFNLMLEKHRK